MSTKACSCLRQRRSGGGGPRSGRDGSACRCLATLPPLQGPAWLPLPSWRSPHPLGVVTTTNHACRFFSSLIQRAAKMHRRLRGGTMTLLLVTPGVPASGERRGWGGAEAPPAACLTGLPHEQPQRCQRCTASSGTLELASEPGFAPALCPRLLQSVSHPPRASPPPSRRGSACPRKDRCLQAPLARPEGQAAGGRGRQGGGGGQRAGAGPPGAAHRGGHRPGLLPPEGKGMRFAMRGAVEKQHGPAARRLRLLLMGRRVCPSPPPRLHDPAPGCTHLPCTAANLPILPFPAPSLLPPVRVVRRW